MTNLKYSQCDQSIFSMTKLVLSNVSIHSFLAVVAALLIHYRMHPYVIGISFVASSIADIIDDCSLLIRACVQKPYLMKTKKML